MTLPTSPQIGGPAGTFPGCLPHQLCQEVTSHTVQEPSGLFHLCYVVIWADIC